MIDPKMRQADKDTIKALFGDVLYDKLDKLKFILVTYSEQKYVHAMDTDKKGSY